MNLTKFLKDKDASQTAFAEKSGIPKSSLSEHLKYEAGLGSRPLGLDLCKRAIEHGDRLITLADLRADIAATVNQIRELEYQNGNGDNLESKTG